MISIRVYLETGLNSTTNAWRYSATTACIRASLQKNVFQGNGFV
jgi:hypothetical protein